MFGKNTFNSVNKRKTRLYFVVDNALRDFPPISLVAYIIERLGYQCDFISTTDLTTFWWKYNNCVIILNKPLLSSIPFNFMKLLRCKFAALNTEGAMGARFIDPTCIGIDLMLFWNRNDQELFMKKMPDFRGKKRVVGTPRTDLLFHSRKIQDKADNKEKLKILVTSPGGYLGRGGAGIMIQKRNKLKS